MFVLSKLTKFIYFCLEWNSFGRPPFIIWEQGCCYYLFKDFRMPLYFLAEPLELKIKICITQTPGRTTYNQDHQNLVTRNMHWTWQNHKTSQQRKTFLKLLKMFSKHIVSIIIFVLESPETEGKSEARSTLFLLKINRLFMTFQ